MTLNEALGRDLTPEEKKKRAKRNERFSEIIAKGYENTFVKSVEKAVNKLYCGDDISKIVLKPFLNTIQEIHIFDKNGDEIKDEKLEEKIRKFWAMKRKALDHNSDRRFKERNKINHVDNLYNRCVGEGTL